jgi:short chain dehydrogenase
VRNSSPSPFPTSRGRHGGRPFQTRLVHHRLLDRIWSRALRHPPQARLLRRRDGARQSESRGHCRRPRQGWARACARCRQTEADRRRGQGGRGPLRPHRRAREQCRLRLSRGDRGGRRCRRARDLRHQFLRPRRHDAAVLPIMRAQKSGAIVNISSIGGFIGFPGSGYYAATKFAVEGLSEALSKEVAPARHQSPSLSSPAPSAPTGPAAL